MTASAWQPLVRRLYALALGSVLLSVVAAVLVAGLVEPPPSPGIIRAALWRLAQHVDDPVSIADELETLRDAGLTVAVYAVDGALIASNEDPAPPLPPHGDRLGGVIDGRGPVHSPRAFDGRGPRRHDDVRPHAERPRKSGALDRHEFIHKERVIVDRIVAPSGREVFAVIVLPGDAFKLALVGGVVLVLLALFSVPFAMTLTRPLGELARATESFGGGEVTARVDMAKAGAYAGLARTFNEMAERVAASMRTEKELLANVSHELRTPLSRIRVALDLADEGDTEMARESLRDIEGDLGELERLVDDILTHARLDSARSPLGTPLRRAPTALTSLLADAAARFSTSHAGHVLERQIDPALPTLDVDAVLLRRALDNLLDNAGKYSEPGSTVTLAALVEGAHVVITVRDRGVGISAEDLARLYTPFFRADKSRARQSGGIGLGLLLAKRVVEAHAGTIDVDSALRVGTTVRVRLPIATA